MFFFEVNTKRTNIAELSRKRGNIWEILFLKIKKWIYFLLILSGITFKFIPNLFPLIRGKSFFFVSSFKKMSITQLEIEY